MEVLTSAPRTDRVRSLDGGIVSSSAARVPSATIGEFVGQRSLKVTADTYTHVLMDETELDYAQLVMYQGAWRALDRYVTRIVTLALPGRRESSPG